MDAFQTQGYVALVRRETLENVLEAGHATMHRFYSPQEEDVDILLDVTDRSGLCPFYLRSRLRHGATIAIEATIPTGTEAKHAGAPTVTPANISGSADWYCNAWAFGDARWT